MSAQLDWARGVVKAGKPARDLSIQDRADAYSELAIAYGVLAGNALKDGDLDRYLEYSELSEQADITAHQLRPVESRGW